MLCCLTKSPVSNKECVNSIETTNVQGAGRLCDLWCWKIICGFFSPPDDAEVARVEHGSQSEDGTGGIDLNCREHVSDTETDSQSEDEVSHVSRNARAAIRTVR